MIILRCNFIETVKRAIRDIGRKDNPTILDSALRNILLDVLMAADRNEPIEVALFPNLPVKRPIRCRYCDSLSPTNPCPECSQSPPETLAEAVRSAAESEIAKLKQQLAAERERALKAEQELETWATASSERIHGASGLCCLLRLSEKRRAEATEARVKALEVKADAFDAIWQVCVELGMVVYPPGVDDDGVYQPEEYAFQFGFLRGMKSRIDELEAENAKLREQQRKSDIYLGRIASAALDCGWDQRGPVEDFIREQLANSTQVVQGPAHLPDGRWAIFERHRSGWVWCGFNHPNVLCDLIDGRIAVHLPEVEGE